MIADLLFYMFATLLLAGATGVVVARNPMYSVLFLVFTFFNSAGVMLLLGAEFFALLLIMVYVGAIAVMFLFVLMTINIETATTKGNQTKYLPIGLLLAALLLVELIIAAWHGMFNGITLAGAPLHAGQNIVQLGNVLFTNYAIPFQLAGAILLVAMVGSIVLVHRSRGGVKRQKVSEQLFRKRDDCLTLTQPPSGQGVTTIGVEINKQKLLKGGNK